MQCEIELDRSDLQVTTFAHDFRETAQHSRFQRYNFTELNAIYVHGEQQVSRLYIAFYTTN